MLGTVKKQKKANKSKKAPAGEVSKTEETAVAQDNYPHPLIALREEIDRLFDGFHLTPPRQWDVDWPRFPRLPGMMGGLEAMPKTDVSETAKDYVIRAELPGMSEDNVDVEMNGEFLTIKGEKRTEREEKEADYHLRECSFGSVRRSFRIPEGVSKDDIKAEFEHGVLTLTLQKTETAIPKKITVKAKGK